MRICSARRTTSATNSSWMPDCTNTRDPATQLWPEAPKLPANDPFTAPSKSASSNTRIGDLPPSSRVTGARLWTVLATTWRAVSTPPVKATLSTMGWLVSARPHGSPNPVRRFTTPGGKPTSSTTRANSSRGAGATSDALMTTVLPAASAGPTLVAVRNISAFHGTMAATTPTGSRVV